MRTGSKGTGNYKILRTKLAKILFYRSTGNYFIQEISSPAGIKSPNIKLYKLASRYPST